LENVDPFCNSPNFFPTLPTHEDTGVAAILTAANDPSPGIEDTDGSDGTLYFCPSTVPLVVAEVGREEELTSGTDNVGDRQVSLQNPFRSVNPDPSFGSA